MPWGKHLIVDCANCDKAAITDAATIKAFAQEMVSSIGMVAFGPPSVEHFGHDDPKTSGYTLVQLIETSNITAHFCDESGDAYIDVFSCKDFDTNIALRVIKTYFDPEYSTILELDRQAPSEADMVELYGAGAEVKEV